MHPRHLPLAAVALALASCAGSRHGHGHGHGHGHAGPPHSPYLLEPSAARTIDFPGHFMRVLLDAGAQEGDVVVYEITVPPRTLGAPPHRHRHEDELFYVLEGELVFLSGDDERRCGPGMVASLPREHVHGFWNASDAPARALLSITPAGFGAFFDEVVAQLEARRPEDPAAVGALLGEVAARYGCEIEGQRVGPILERYGLR